MEATTLSKLASFMLNDDRQTMGIASAVFLISSEWGTDTQSYIFMTAHVCPQLKKFLIGVSFRSINIQNDDHQVGQQVSLISVGVIVNHAILSAKTHQVIEILNSAMKRSFCHLLYMILTPQSSARQCKTIKVVPVSKDFEGRIG